MKTVFNVYKPVGTTPLETINLFKNKYPVYKNKKIAYAGRLDPMAEGVMLLIVEPETKNREKYQKLDKEYEFDVLFGVGTDTYDVLGLIQNLKVKNQNYNLNSKNINSEVQKLIGKHKQLYPPYSSASINGKSLFWWARQGKLNEIEIPSKEIEIYSANLLSVKNIDKDKIKQLVLSRIRKISGDFRQKEIIATWNKFFNNTLIGNFPVAKIKIHASSGTYVRSIANDIGKNLKTGAIALNIKRTLVGNYKLEDSLIV
jgi:tRNA pseudouridine55 synthase